MNDHKRALGQQWLVLGELWLLRNPSTVDGAKSPDSWLESWLLYFSSSFLKLQLQFHPKEGAKKPYPLKIGHFYVAQEYWNFWILTLWQLTIDPLNSTRLVIQFEILFYYIILADFYQTKMEKASNMAQEQCVKALNQQYHYNFSTFRRLEYTTKKERETLGYCGADGYRVCNMNGQVVPLMGTSFLNPPQLSSHSLPIHSSICNFLSTHLHCPVTIKAKCQNIH